MTKLRSIHLVPTFHYDVAYLRTCAQYLPDCFKILDAALNLLQQDEQYFYTIEQTFLLEEYCARYPEKLALLKQFAAQGRLSLAPGMYVMPDMNMPDAESLIMQIHYGRAFCRDHLGIEPRACWIADCWGHHAQLPQILRKCGYESYFFWRAMREDVLKNDFHWRGIDGTTIQAHWLARGYANVRFSADFEAANAANITELVTQLQAYGPSPALLLCNGGDMAMPQTAAPRAVEAINELAALPPIRFSTPAIFAAQFSEQAHVPTVSGEFNAAFQGTFTTNIRVKQENRRLVARLLGLETLLATLGQTTDLDQLWKLLLKQQFHDILCGTITDAALAECHQEHKQVSDGIDAILAGFTGSPALFNPLPWPRKELIEHDAKPSLIDLPALGSAATSAAVPLAQTALPQLPLTWENEFLQVSIDRSGSITSLTDRPRDQQLANPAHPCPFGALSLQMDYGDSWLNFEGPLNGGVLAASLTHNFADPFDRGQPNTLAHASTFLPTIQSAEVVLSSADVVVVRQTGWLGFWSAGVEFQTTITLRRWSPRIDYHTTILPKGKNIRIRVAFPTSVSDAKRYDEIPMGIQIGRRGEHAVQNWLCWCNPLAGLALLNRGTPAGSVHDAILMQTLFRSVAMEYKAPSESSYNLGIPHTFDYAIMPATSTSLASVIREGLLLNHPPLATTTSPAIPAPPVVLDSGQVILSRLQLRPDGSLLLRLYEPVGSPSIAILRITPKWTSIAETDPFGEKSLRDIPRVADRIVIPIKPFEFKTLLLRT